MPAQPQVGLDYYQEHPPGVALDCAAITAADPTLDAGGLPPRRGRRRFSELDPALSGYKWYAPGVGLVL